MVASRCSHNKQIKLVEELKQSVGDKVVHQWCQGACACGPHGEQVPN